MTTLKMALLGVMVLLAALTAAAKGLTLPPESEPPLRQGAIIEVEKIDAKSQVVYLVLPSEPAVGPNRARLADLAKSIPGVDLKKDPEALIGNQYKLDKELPLLSDLGVAKELKKKSQKPRKK